MGPLPRPNFHLGMVSNDRSRGGLVSDDDVIRKRDPGGLGAGRVPENVVVLRRVSVQNLAKDVADSCLRTIRRGWFNFFATTLRPGSHLATGLRIGRYGVSSIANI